jgi:adenylate kinase
MLGPPGAGKGTQAERLARKRNVPRISTGDILREAVQADTAIGRAAKAVMESGRLVGDDVMVSIVKERLQRPDVAGGFVLDGFPRTVVQAQALDEMLDSRNAVAIVSIEVPETTLVERLGGRRICVKCGWSPPPGVTECGRCGGQLVRRKDDTVDVVRERLRIYERDTQPLLEYYHGRAGFRAVDGDQTPDAVAADLAAAVASVAGALP